MAVILELYSNYLFTHFWHEHKIADRSVIFKYYIQAKFFLAHADNTGDMWPVQYTGYHWLAENLAPDGGPGSDIM